MSSQSIPETPPEYDHTRIIERPDGFYWLDKETNAEYGPFETLMAAVEDMEYKADSDYEPVESLHEAEEEIGISDWIDPDTGLPAEESSTHLSDQ
jgi:hypothetical protein